MQARGRQQGSIDRLALLTAEELVNAAGEKQVVHYATATLLVLEDGEWRNLATHIVYLDDDQIGI